MVNVTVLFSLHRAATWVRRTEGERRRRRRRRGARSHRLRCGRMRWYGGVQGGLAPPERAVKPSTE